MLVTSNITALNSAFRILEGTNRKLGGVENALSTGLKVTGARDDASVFAVAQGVRASQKSLQASIDSLKALRGKFAAAQSAGETVFKNMTELKGALANYLGAQGDQTSQRIYQDGINSILRDITRIGNNTLVGQVNNDLSVVATVDTPVDALDVVSDGQYLYVADLSGGVLAYTLTGGTLNLVGSTAVNARSLWLDNGRIYVGGQTGTVSILDFDGANFTTLASANVSAAAIADVRGDGQYLYVSNTTNGVYAYRYDASSLTYVAQYNTPGQAVETAIHGSQIYVSDTGTGIIGLGFDGRQFNLVSTDATYTVQQGVWIDQNGQLYSSNSGAGVSFYSVNEGDLTYISQNPTPGNAVEVIGDGHRFFVATQGSLRAYAFSNGAYTLLSAYNNAGTNFDVTDDGEYLYLPIRGSGFVVLSHPGHSARVSVPTGPDGTMTSYKTHAMTSSALGLGVTAPNDFALGPGGFERIDRALGRAGKYMAEIGNNIRDIDSKINFLQMQLDASVEGVGTLVDADIAKTQARLVGLQLQQELTIEGIRNAGDRHRNNILTLYG